MEYDNKDPVISNQKYCIISYILPKETDSKSNLNPMIKIRGSYASMEECEKKVKQLTASDTYFNKYIIDVGDWGCLLTDSQIRDKNFDVEYQNTEMDAFMKAYKKKKDEDDREFVKRHHEMKKKIEDDGTQEGQVRLSEQKEHPVAVKQRLFSTKETIDRLRSELQYNEDLYDSTKLLLENYTQEEIEIGEKEYLESQAKQNI